MYTMVVALRNRKINIDVVLVIINDVRFRLSLKMFGHSRSTGPGVN